MPSTTDRWHGPDVDAARQTTVQNLSPGSPQQTFRIVVPYPAGSVHRIFRITVRDINYSEEI